MKVELFYTPGCKKCAASLTSLKTTAEQAFPDLEWREINPVDEIDYAVALGVLTLPAVAIDGELAFSSLPTATELGEALQQRSREARNGR